MRVLFTSFALDAHYLGSVPLAWAMRTAGHEVRVASQPALTKTITGAGLTAVPLGTDHAVLRALADSEHANLAARWHALDMDPARPEVNTWGFLKTVNDLLPESFFQPVNGTLVDGLVGFARSWRPDLVIWEPFTFAGAVAAKAAGAAHARLLWGADLFGAQRAEFLRQRAAQPRDNSADALADWLAGILDRYDLSYDEEVVYGQWTIDQMPPGIRIATDRRTVPMRYIPYNGTAVIPDWLHEPPARPRVCLTLGVTARDVTDDVFGSLGGLFDALADLDIDVVATLNAAQRADAGRIPPNVHTYDFVPLQALLSSCSVVAHHGGAGTWSTAAAAGVPQLIFPSLWDNPYRARRTAELGAGLVLRRDELTAQTLRDGLLRLLRDARFTDGAERLRREMAAGPSPNDVVAELAKLTLEYQEPVG